MNKYVAGFIAGFTGTLVLSLLMVMKTNLGVLPQFDVIGDFNQFLGSSEYPILGWIIHLGLGTFIWGSLFVVIHPVLLGAFWLKGIIFGIIAWLLMMVGFMPTMAHGLFALGLGIQVTIMTLVLHVIFGFVLGLVYGWIPKEDV